MLKAYEYNIINEDEVQKSEDTHTPPKGTLVTLVTSGSDGNPPQKGSIERGEGDEPSTEELEPGFNRGDGKVTKVTKVTKVPKKGVCQNKKNVCDKCGGDGATELYKDCYFHPKCLEEVKHEETKKKDEVPKVPPGISLGPGIEYESKGAKK
jgi:hypothetical protein